MAVTQSAGNRTGRRIATGVSLGSGALYAVFALIALHDERTGWRGADWGSALLGMMPALVWPWLLWWPYSLGRAALRRLYRQPRVDVRRGLLRLTVGFSVVGLILGAIAGWAQAIGQTDQYGRIHYLTAVAVAVGYSTAPWVLWLPWLAILGARWIVSGFKVQDR